MLHLSPSLAAWLAGPISKQSSHKMATTCVQLAVVFFVCFLRLLRRPYVCLAVRSKLTESLLISLYHSQFLVPGGTEFVLSRKTVLLHQDCVCVCSRVIVQFVRLQHAMSLKFVSHSKAWGPTRHPVLGNAASLSCMITSMWRWTNHILSVRQRKEA